MGEEKKPEEEKKMEEKKPEQEAEKEKKEEKDAEKKPEQEGEEKESKDPKEEEEKKPQDIVLRIYMHCEGCARKVRHFLKGFDGVEDVMTDYKTSKVVVKGEKADPLKVLERVQRKTHKKVELLSPVPPPAPPPEDVPEKKPEENSKTEEKKVEPVTVVLRVYMHCEACAMEIQKRIQRMKGVESAEPDLKASQVTVKGVFEPTKLVQYIHKRTGKHVAVVSQDPEPEKAEENNKEKKEENSEKKGGEEKPKEEADKNKEGKEGSNKEEKKKGKKGKNKEAKDSGGKPTEGGEKVAAPVAAAVAEGTKVVEVVERNEYCYQAPRYPMEMYAYPPQIFSDENPNACMVM